MGFWNQKLDAKSYGDSIGNVSLRNAININSDMEQYMNTNTYNSDFLLLFLTIYFIINANTTLMQCNPKNVALKFSNAAYGVLDSLVLNKSEDEHIYDYVNWIESEICDVFSNSHGNAEEVFPKLSLFVLNNLNPIKYNPQLEKLLQNMLISEWKNATYFVENKKLK